MKRTKLPKPVFKAEHLNIIASIAWSFHRTTGLPFDELYAEGCLEYCEAMLTYNGVQSATFTTYLTKRLKYYLILYSKQNNKIQTNALFTAENVGKTPVYEYWEWYKPDIQTIVDIVRNSNGEISGVPPKMARGVIRRELREQGWSWPRIWDAIRETKQMVYETPIGDLTICES